jgi:ATP-dependent Lon protease
MAEQIKTEENKKFTIPEVLPVLSLHNALVFPKMMIPLEIVGNDSSLLVDEAMTKDRLVGLIMAKRELTSEKDHYKLEDFHPIGTCAVILRMAKASDSRTQMLLQGISRFQILELVEGKPYQQARIKVIEEAEVKDIETEALMANLLVLFDRILKLSPFLPPEFSPMAKSINEAGTLADMITSIINAIIIILVIILIIISFLLVFICCCKVSLK